jgi:hypothetical protein
MRLLDEPTVSPPNPRAGNLGSAVTALQTSMWAFQTDRLSEFTALDIDNIRWFRKN